MRGFAFKCEKCGSLRIIPKEKVTYTDGLICDECRCNLFPFGLVNYEIDYRTEEENKNTSHNAKLTETKEEISFSKIFRIKQDDTLILKTDILLREEDARKIQEDIHKRTGLRVALFDGRTDIIGVVEYGT